MGKKLNKTRSNPLFSAKEKEDKFSMIYDSMITSAAFESLPGSAVYFYLCCRNQAASKTGRANLYKYLQELAKDFALQGDAQKAYIEKRMNGNYFTFPAEHQENIYHVKRQNGSRAIKILKEHGFIIVEVNGQQQRKQNLYKFSDAWKDWKQEEP